MSKTEEITSSYQSTGDIHRFLNTVENQKFYEDVEHFDGKELSARLAQLNQTKVQLKEAFSVQTVSKDMFLKCLCEDIQGWPTQKQLEDQQMQEVSQQLKACKNSIDQKKTSAEELVSCAEESYDMLKTKISELKEIALKRELKLKELQELRNKRNKVAEHVPTNLKEAILIQRKEAELVESDIVRHQGSLAEAKANQIRLQQDIEAVKNKLTQQQEERQKSQTITAKKTAALREKVKEDTELLHYIRKLSGIRELPVEDPDAIQLEFISEGQDDSSLHLTMQLAADLSGRVYLKGAEVNIESLPVEDLIGAAVERNDPVMLVQTLKERWRSYKPIVSEIRKLSERHAVDWIQEEGVVRVLLGKRGTVICTLSVPKTYPQEGSISLVSVHGGYGEEGPMELEEKEEKSLQQWVDYLEEKYSKT
uniref:Uncharacterized protein LOC111130825 isoform X1 n=2 Tax=Crassostrea virginica TaxID=6565 RepID=A0A8B8E0L8_CRAVI|nr:uncharacterized protein LOC111130825 isoform X1 [Crassostrea virginica]